MEDDLPIVVESGPTTFLGVYQSCELAALRAVPAKDRRVPAGSSSATARTNRAPIYRFTFLVDDAQPGICDPAGFAKPCRSIFFGNPSFFCEGKGPFMMPAGISVI
ncbi:hypothetical protein NS277_07795 [Novosphingobium barchaimii]|nr:hypothetical protein NS277_07795 [Novosphingobium barchaimii]